MPDIITQDILFFFDGRPVELGLYEHLAAEIFARWSDTAIRVKKTQIGFYCPGLFCCVSLTPVRRKAERPERFITVTFGLDHPLDDPRALVVPVGPNRYTHHVLLGRAGEIDETLLGWLDAAHRFTTERTVNHART